MVRIRLYDPDKHEIPAGKQKQGFTLDWVSELGWKRDPFVSEDWPIAGMEDERKEINLFFVKNRRLGVIQGAQGMGKTTLLTWLQRELKGYPNMDVHVIDAGTTHGDAFRHAIAEPFQGFFRHVEPESDELLHELIDRKARGRYVLLVDNADHLSRENMETIAHLLKLDSAFVLATAHPLKHLPVRDELELTLRKRSVTDYLRILEHRITRVGGDGMRPFTKSVVERMARDTAQTAELLALAHETAINVALKRAELEEDVSEERIAEEEERNAERKRGIKPKPVSKSEEKRRKYDDLIESLTDGME